MIKKILFKALPYTFITLLGISCIFNNKYEDFSTELRVNVKIADGNSHSQAGVNVALYRSISDMETRALPVMIGKTDASGNVVFKGLRPVEFYVYADYELNGFVYDNSVKDHRLFDDLVSGSITQVNVEITKARPSKPTIMVVKSLELISFDTLSRTITNNNTINSCSKDLYFYLMGSSSDANAPNNDLFTDTLGKTNTPIKFCYENSQPNYLNPIVGTPDYSSILQSSVNFITNIQIPLANYDAIYLYVATAPKLVLYSKPSATQYPGSETSSIKSVILGNYLVTNGKFTAYPNRIRVMEDNYREPVVQRRIIDLTLEWK